MALEPSSSARFNLADARLLLVDDTPVGLSILTQIVMGLGARRPICCDSVEEARAAVTDTEIDLAIIDGLAGSGGGYELVRWIRAETGPPNCYTPILVTSGLARTEDVVRTRDSGGNIIVRKPIAPATLLQRIAWVARGDRTFLFSDKYIGPDRRFRDVGPPGGVTRRRDGIVSFELDESAGPKKGVLSGVRFVKPKLRLTEVMAAPGGLSADEAIARASQNLEAIKPTCHAQMMVLLERADAGFAEIGDPAAAPAIAALRNLVVSGIGGGEASGAPGVDETLKSLADLIDSLAPAGGFDRAPIGVHLRAWRLLMNDALDAAGRAAILDGLRSVSAHVAREAPPAAGR